MFESKFWVEIFQARETRFVVWVTLLGIMVCVGIYLVKLFRDLAIGGSDNGPEELLTRIRDLKESGLVDDLEYHRLNQSFNRQTATKNSLIGKNPLASNPHNSTSAGPASAGTASAGTEPVATEDEQPDFEEWKPPENPN